MFRGGYPYDPHFWRRGWGRFPRRARGFWRDRPGWGWGWGPYCFSWCDAPGAPPWAGPYEVEETGADLDEAEWLKAEAAELRAEAEAIKKELAEIEKRLAEIKRQEEE
jgi:hypothetical protein